MNNKQHVNNIHKELDSLLKVTKSFCKNNTNIIFTKVDKGNITVALNRTYYINNVNEILKDSTTYEIIRKTLLKTLNKN